MDVYTQLKDCNGSLIKISDYLRCLRTRRVFRVTGAYDYGWQVWIMEVGQGFLCAWPIYRGESFEIVTL